MLTLSPVVYALGTAQIISWGSLFYAVGVLGPHMGRELGVSELFLFGAFTAALIVSGTLAPRVGRLVDERGGRSVLSLGSILAALSLVVLALASNGFTLVLGWLIAGMAMSACLYDPAFATLSQQKGLEYRSAVGTLTIMGAFASTIFWPISHIFTDAFGWRATWAIFAGLHLFVCLPLHRLFVPRRLHFTLPGESEGKLAVRARHLKTRLRRLTLAFALSSFVCAVIAVHVISLLRAAGLSEAQAISIAMLIGPMQVVGRLADLGASSKVSAVTFGYAPFLLLLLALLALFNVSGPGIHALIFVVAFGWANGIFTIARGAVPRELFGADKLGELLGYMSRASLYSRALAPASFSAMAALGYTRGSSLAILAIFAGAGLIAYSGAVRVQPQPESKRPI
jgi:MFS family permease